MCVRGACAQWYALVREKVVRLRNAYPLLAIGEAVGMLLASLEHLSRASFDTRSELAPDSAGKQNRVVAPEHNWVLPLLLSLSEQCNPSAFNVCKAVLWIIVLCCIDIGGIEHDDK